MQYKTKLFSSHLRGEGSKVPSSLAVELEEVGVELGEGGPVRDRQQGHTRVLRGLKEDEVFGLERFFGSG